MGLSKEEVTWRVFIVDDDQDLCETVKELLEPDGFSVEFTLNPAELLDLDDDHVPDLLLLDQNLSGQKGTDWLNTIKNKQRFAHLPVIMLTGVDESENKVLALNLGADDYVIKPFSARELIARIRAVLRRTSPKDKPTQIQSKGLVVDRLTHQLILNGTEIPVTLSEFKIVYELVKNKDAVLTRDHLREMALGKSNVTDRTIDVHVAALRKKLGNWSKGIKTVRGVGYRYSE
jgi:two-component system alkaline phosphatase synthesis response regulator PhoP